MEFDVITALWTSSIEWPDLIVSIILNNMWLAQHEEIFEHF